MRQFRFFMNLNKQKKSGVGKTSAAQYKKYQFSHFQLTSIQ
jgi:hypothetical protein